MYNMINTSTYIIKNGMNIYLYIHIYMYVCINIKL